VLRKSVDRKPTAEEKRLALIAARKQ
jgi:hypothetical protein